MSAKYPRTFHLPWSPGGTNDDKRMKTVEHLLGVPTIMTEKMDGGNVCLTKDAVYARSHASEPTEPWYDWLKAKHHGELRWIMPPDSEIFCEYLYAVHSIEYETLPSYLMVLGVRWKNNYWLSWDDTEDTAHKIGLVTPYITTKTTFYKQERLVNLTNMFGGGSSAYGPTREGIVIRTANGFKEEDFSLKVGKWVRANHVQTNEHWTKGLIRRNKLRGQN